MPAGFERFLRLIEVVSSVDEQDRGHARLRWKQYASRGYAIARRALAAGQSRLEYFLRREDETRKMRITIETAGKR